MNRIRPFIKGLFNKGPKQGMSDLLHAIKAATKIDVLLKFSEQNQVGSRYG